MILVYGIYLLIMIIVLVKLLGHNLQDGKKQNINNGKMLQKYHTFQVKFVFIDVKVLIQYLIVVKKMDLKY